MSNNRITQIQPATFSRRIAKVILNNNQLSYIRERGFRSIYNKLYAKGNSIVCDCSLKWLIQKTKFPEKLAQATCSSPSPYANQKLYSLRRNTKYAEYCGIEDLDTPVPVPLFGEEVVVTDFDEFKLPPVLSASPKAKLEVQGTASPVDQNTLIVGEGDLITLTCGARNYIMLDETGAGITSLFSNENFCFTNRNEYFILMNMS